MSVGITALDFEIEPDDGQYHVFCPKLLGFHCSGQTEEDAWQNATDALHAWLLSLSKHGEPWPFDESSFHSWQADDGYYHALDIYNGTEAVADSLEEAWAVMVISSAEFEREIEMWDGE